MMYLFEQYLSKFIHLYFLTLNKTYFFNITPYFSFSKYNLDLENNLPLFLNERKVSHKCVLNLNINKQSSLNRHFLSQKSMIVSLISVWQYWWWLSFIFVMIIFNKLLTRFFLQNTIKLEPKIYTSLKSNARWGDLAATLFPLFWCSNILLNSNMILKLIENHTESGLYLLRVRGKQWYWVYKFSINSKNDINSINLIIGRNNKIKINYGFINRDVTNVPIMGYRWSKKIKSIKFKNKKLSFTDNYFKLNKNLKNNLSLPYSFTNLQTHLSRYLTVSNKKIIKVGYKLKHDKFYSNQTKIKLNFCKVYPIKNNKLFCINSDYGHSYRLYNRYFFTLQQQSKKKINLNKKNKLINFNTLNSFDFNNIKIIKLKKIKRMALNNKKSFLKKTRMLSTYNTLILPTKVNITVITNSFDVVHSWFIPGLGLKFDCVPGRSTHYTLKIQKPGIYYGHCAEVCGRFHHHMPIKICAVSLQHFNYYYSIQNKLE